MSGGTPNDNGLADGIVFSDRAGDPIESMLKAGLL